jgi:hypothetical protein
MTCRQPVVLVPINCLSKVVVDREIERDETSRPGHRREEDLVVNVTIG